MTEVKQHSTRPLGAVTPNAGNDFREIEAQRFATHNPLISNNIRFKKMYWSSNMEIVARGLLLLIGVLLLIFAYFIAHNVLSPLLVSKGIIVPNKTSLQPNHIVYIFLAVTFGFNFLFFIPLAIGRNASTLFSWSILYIVLAICFFIFVELFLTVLLVIDGLINSAIANAIPAFMLFTLLITVLWLVGACLLVVKSDDVRKELSVE